METTEKNKRVHLGYNVKRLREILGIKQEDLADRLKLSQQSVSKLENKDELDNETVERLVQALNIPSAVIKNFTDEEIIQIISNNFADNASIRNNPINNPIERIVQLYDEKMELYERMLKSEQEKVSFLEALLWNKSNLSTEGTGG